VAIREGKWKCTYCGQVNQGRETKCQQCGQPRGKDVKFFLEDDAAEVTDQNLIDVAQAGADWTCEFCSTDNRARETRCRQCGAERGSSPSLKEKFVPQGDAAQSGAPSSAAPQSRRRMSPVAIVGILAGVAAVCVLFYFLFFSASEKTAVLDSGQWERTIAVEENKWVEHTDWEDAVPHNAMVLESRQEKYGTEKIQTGTEHKKTGQKDMGNGFFQDVYEDVPVYTERDVYKNRVRYKIQEWVVTRTLKSGGDLSSAPAWPAVTLAAAEREGKRAEHATLFLTRGDKRYQYSPPVSELHVYSQGAKYKIWVTPLGAVTKIEAQ
jgi:hypothetical protein